MSAKPKSDKANNVKLVPVNAFKDGMKKILSNTKSESDKQLAKFQADNLRRRKVKKKR